MLERLAGKVPAGCRQAVGRALVQVRQQCKATRPHQRPTAAAVVGLLSDLARVSQGCDCLGPALQGRGGDRGAM